MAHYRTGLKDYLVEHIPQSLFRTFLQFLETHQDRAESAGYHVYPRSYFSPMPLKEEMDFTVLDRRRRLPGIPLHEETALELLKTLGAYALELQSIPSEPTGKDPFWFDNDWFADFDAAILYSLLRHLKPRRFIELGCGFSSLISSLALSRNITDGFPSEVVYADPHPRTEVASLLNCGRLIQTRLQNLPIELFTGLEAGDVLFIDTSHVLKVQSDVVHILVTILPSLKPGVWIHVHDVFTPYDYPREWVTHPLFSDNEQYALEAMLNGGDRYSVELPLYLVWKEHPAVMKTFFPRGQRQPGSFWMHKRHA